MLPLASPLARYAVAVAATALAVAFRGALTPLWGQHLPLIMFYPAIMVSAWLGGFGPGILATTLSAASAALLWPLRMGDNMADLVGLAVFVGIGLFISTLTRALHVTRERLASHVRALEKDASTREKAEEAQARLASIVQHSDDAIVSKTLEGVITSWNDAATRIFGYLPEEVIGRSITIIIPADRLDEETQVLTAIRRGESIEHFDTIRVRKDGSQIPISLTVSPVRN